MIPPRSTGARSIGDPSAAGHFEVAVAVGGPHPMPGIAQPIGAGLANVSELDPSVRARSDAASDEVKNLRLSKNPPRARSCLSIRRRRNASRLLLPWPRSGIISPSGLNLSSRAGLKKGRFQHVRSKLRYRIDWTGGDGPEPGVEHERPRLQGRRVQPHRLQGGRFPRRTRPRARRWSARTRSRRCAGC